MNNLRVRFLKKLKLHFGLKVAEEWFWYTLISWLNTAVSCLLMFLVLTKLAQLQQSTAVTKFFEKPISVLLGTTIIIMTFTNLLNIIRVGYFNNKLHHSFSYWINNLHKIYICPEISTFVQIYLWNKDSSFTWRDWLQTVTRKFLHNLLFFILPKTSSFKNGEFEVRDNNCTNEWGAIILKSKADYSLELLKQFRVHIRS